MSQDNNKSRYNRHFLLGGAVLAATAAAYVLGRSKQPTAATESSSGFLNAFNHISLSLFGGVEKKTGLSSGGLTAASAVGMLGAGVGWALSGHEKAAAANRSGNHLNGRFSGGAGVGNKNCGNNYYTAGTNTGKP